MNKNPSEKFKIGFTKTPDRTQIGYFVNHILDDETKELTYFTTSKIEEVSEKFGILLDVKIFKPDKPQKETKEQNQHLQRNEKTKEICHIIQEEICSVH